MSNSDGTLRFNTQLDTSGLSTGLKGLGTVTKVVAAGASAAATALGKITQESIEAYADYEQLVGGIETLFGAGGQTLQEYADSVGKTTSEVSAEYANLINAQESLFDYADNAYETAGMSANDYMETATSFAASLVSSLGGDTAAAVEYANTAITDMSDNANKMGTDIESIQNAYQGFAKQNYTMLDNLNTMGALAA